MNELRSVAEAAGGGGGRRWWQRRRQRVSDDLRHGFLDRRLLLPAGRSRRLRHRRERAMQSVSQ